MVRRALWALLVCGLSACAPTPREVRPERVMEAADEGGAPAQPAAVSQPTRPDPTPASGPSILVDGAPPTIIACHDPASGWLEPGACAEALPAGVDLGLFGRSARVVGSTRVVSELVGAESVRLDLEPALEVEPRELTRAPGVRAWPYALRDGGHPARVGEWDDYAEVLSAARPLAGALGEETAGAVAGPTGHAPGALELVQRETIRRASASGEVWEATFTSLVCVAPECGHFEGCEGECDPDEFEPYQDHYLVVEEVGQAPALVASGPRAWLLEGHTDLDGSGVPELIVMLPARVYDEAAWIARGDDLGAASPGWGVRFRWQRQAWVEPDDAE
jgi:hypothetical protein